MNALLIGATAIVNMFNHSIPNSLSRIYELYAA